MKCRRTSGESVPPQGTALADQAAAAFSIADEELRNYMQSATTTAYENLEAAFTQFCVVLYVHIAM